MSMVSQGYPLWASNPDGFTYAVVGWDEHGYPSLVPVGEPAGGAESPRTGQAYTFTTTDPTERPERWTIAAPDDLRERLHRLVDEIERADIPGTVAARRIRTELGK